MLFGIACCESGKVSEDSSSFLVGQEGVYSVW